MFDSYIAFARFERHWHNFAFKRAAFNRGIGAAQAFDGIIVHLLTRHLVVVRRILSESAHRAAFLIGIFKSVEEHMIIRGVMAKPRAGTVLFEQIRRARHAFHAACDDKIDCAAGQRFCAHDNRLHA